MDLLVSQSKTVTVKVYVWEKDARLNASTEKIDIPEENVDAEEIEFYFRLPNHADSVAIQKAAKIQIDDESGRALQMDIASFQDVALTRLLVGWNLKTKDGDDVEFKASNIQKLNALVARTAIERLLNLADI